MPNLAELSRAVAAYKKGDLRLGAFEDWFRDNSRGMFAESDEVIEACNAIEGAFSRYYFEGISEEILREELEVAIRPLSESASEAVVLSNKAAVAPAPSVSSEWIVWEVRVGGANNSTTISESIGKEFPFWHSENSTRTWDRPSLLPV